MQVSLWWAQCCMQWMRRCEGPNIHPTASAPPDKASARQSHELRIVRVVLGFVVGVVLGWVIDEALAKIESLPRHTVLERYYERHRSSKLLERYYERHRSSKLPERYCERYRSSKLPERYCERYRSSKRAEARAHQPLDEAPVRDSSDFDEPGTALRRGHRPGYPAWG